MTYCVYWIREKSHTDLTSQGYIGVSGNVKERFASHKGMWSGTNNHLRNAIKKYGWDNLEKSVLLIAEKDYCLEIEKKLRPADKIGWNLVVGGGHPPVLIGPRPELRGKQAWNKGMVGCVSDETREKMRLARIGKSPANKGVPLAQERIEQLRQINLGNTYRLGAKMPPHVVEQNRLRNIGKHHSEETKAKMSAAHMGKAKPPRTDEHKRKIGLNAKGKKWYNNGINVVFCFDGLQPEGYVLGRKCHTLVKEC
jgi:hypothetical protein